MENFVFIMEIIGTVAFAVSGAITGIEKKMDIFGVAILGLTTAVGGGIIRDMLIGNTPPQTFQDPIYSVISIILSGGEKEKQYRSKSLGYCVISHGYIGIRSFYRSRNQHSVCGGTGEREIPAYFCRCDNRRRRRCDA